MLSRRLPHFRFDDELDTAWTIGSIIVLGILMITIFLFTKIMQHLYCIPQSVDHLQFQPRHITTYSALSVTFSALSVIVIFSLFPVCTQMDCWDNDNEWSYDITVVVFWTFFVLAKSFLYLIFIDRLFNPHYARIHQYPNSSQYLLWALVIVLVLIVTAWNIAYGVLLTGNQYPDWIDNVCAIAYCITDFLLSVLCMSLFFRPMCLYSVRNPDSLQITNVYVSVAKRYGYISSLRLIAAVLFDLLLIGSVYLRMIGASERLWREYMSIVDISQTCDCMLLMICIYFGFARKTTVCLCAFRCIAN